MPQPAALTRAQHSPRPGGSLVPDLQVNDRPPADRHGPDSYPGVYRGVQQTPRPPRLPRKSSALGLGEPAPAVPVPTTASATARASPTQSPPTQSPPRSAYDYMAVTLNPPRADGPSRLKCVCASW